MCVKEEVRVFVCVREKDACYRSVRCSIAVT